MAEYIILDIETCPIDIEACIPLPEEERKKLLNPIDSKIVAIGLRYNKQTKTFMNENEKELLKDFWKEIELLTTQSGNLVIIGFNILQFDIPFLTSRSFINNVTITPFTLKQVIDLREKINAFRWGHTRGTLKDYARFLGVPTNGDGSEVMNMCIQKDFQRIKEYLENDLLITEKLLERAKQTKIYYINKW